MMEKKPVELTDFGEVFIQTPCNKSNLIQDYLQKWNVIWGLLKNYTNFN